MTKYDRSDLLLLQNLQQILAKERNTYRCLQDELNASHGGKLYIKKTNGRTFYTEYSHGKEQGVGRNKSKVHKLARRNYAMRLCKSSKHCISALETLYDQLMAKSSPDITTGQLKRYENAGLDMGKVLYSPSQQAWLNQPYERNPAYPEELKFETTNNKLMRTKSELIIANRLEYYGIPYLPEKPLFFDYDLYPIYPDFTILKADETEIIWEHMGLMDKEEYFIKNCRRIRRYINNGYGLHTNLIITFEKDIITPGLIDHIIESRLLL